MFCLRSLNILKKQNSRVYCYECECVCVWMFLFFKSFMLIIYDEAQELQKWLISKRYGCNLPLNCHLSCLYANSCPFKLRFDSSFSSLSTFSYFCWYKKCSSLWIQRVFQSFNHNKAQKRMDLTKCDCKGYACSCSEAHYL